MMNGFVGAHRVGKTTLCLSIPGYNGVSVSISEMQKKHGFDSSKQDYPFDVRIEIQETCYNEFARLLLEINKPHFKKDPAVITDRTPLDLIGYTLIHVPENIDNAQQVWLRDYIEKCINLTNSFYSNIILIQPGIPLVNDNTTSAPCDSVMMERLNSIYLSYCIDNRVSANTFMMPRELTDLDERIQYVREAFDAT